MSFDTIDFGVFYLIFLGIYWFVPNTIRLIITLAGSYYFYSSANIIFLPLIIASTLIDYFCALGIKRYDNQKKKFLLLSIGLNLSMLCVFKYYNFVCQIMESIAGYFGGDIELGRLSIGFPVGISFYTLQTISYTVDVYKGEKDAEKNFFKFALFVCYFPQLVAGPLEKAKNLLPQLSAPKFPTYFEAQKYTFFILIGLIRKTVVSDRLFSLVEHGIQNPLELENSAKNIFTIYFMYFKLYYDFSGYSLMGIGLAGLLGVRLSKNFHYPTYSSNIEKFWSNWHITLYNWFRDYVFYPLSEKRLEWKVPIAMFVFFLSGIWHGASFNYIAWGSLNAIYLAIYVYLLKKNIRRFKLRKNIPFRIISIFVTFHFLLAALTLYYIEDVKTAVVFTLNCLSYSDFHLGSYFNYLSSTLLTDLKIAFPLIVLMETLSIVFLVKNISFDSFKKYPVFINGMILVMAVVFLLFYKSSVIPFRYYYY